MNREKPIIGIESKKKKIWLTRRKVTITIKYKFYYNNDNN